MSSPCLRIPILIGLLVVSLCSPFAAVGADLNARVVLEAIERGKKYLLSMQKSDGSDQDGSWAAVERLNHPVGITCLSLLALLQSGMTLEDPAVARCLKYLRRVKEPELTYEISLMIMALAAAKDGHRDGPRIANMVRRLEETQIKTGVNAGSWSYGGRGAIDSGGDRSNAQFAVLGLREAQFAGVTVSRRTWELAHEHWKSQQGADGGWNYGMSGGGRSTGSMTVAGITTMVITEHMLRNVEELNRDGTPQCCNGSEPNLALDKGMTWMQRNFSVGHNPNAGAWLLYYLYGLERAGRLSGRRFFGDHDWYREGAEFLVRGQNQRTGSWQGDGLGEQDPVVGTTFALLFLSKGLSPVLINKLMYRAPASNDPEPWNLHSSDVRNLTEMISGLTDWPRLVTWQEVDIAAAVSRGGVEDLLQAPILFLNGSEAPEFAPAEVDLLREFISQGGFILAEAACDKAGFDAGFRRLIDEMYPQGDYKLKRLPADHAVYRSERPLDPETTELWGVDVGCRTSIMYSPNDYSCLWDKWTPFDPPDRKPATKAMIQKAASVGINIVAYATGREPPNRLDQVAMVAVGADQTIERGFLEIAKLRHTGGWDAAPQALRNLLLALNDYAGVTATTVPKNLPLSDPNLAKYPIVYMHGRNRFQATKQEQERLREYLANGGVLFADACCGAPQFDRGFRELVEQLYPGRKLARIPATHEMFSSEVGHDLRRVKRREPTAANPDLPLRANVVEGEPFLEGIEVDGRYVVIYSKYDISCALERQAAVTCAGYVHEDAVKIAVNVVLYALLE